ncbi:MAG TPA: hypothetical protein VFF73_32440 [Planctomycetota bacterium]|nr:hypothetical protein [Planctomycetota bacterium]
MKRSALAALALLGAACSHQTDTPLGWNPPALPAASAQGPYPHGQVTSATALDLTKRGPRLTVLSPARGAQISASSVAVQLQATSKNTVLAVTIGGAAAQPLGSGVWEATIPLSAGTNFIAAQATDNLGQVGHSTFTVVQGTFQPLAQVISSTVVASLSPAGLARIQPLIDSAVQSIDFQSLLLKANPIVNAAGLATVDALSFQYHPPTTAIAGAANGAQATVTIGNPALLTQANVLGLPVTQATFAAQQATVTFDIVVDPSHPPLGLGVQGTGVSFTGFAVTSNGSLVQAVLQGFQSQVEQLVAQNLSGALQSAIQGFLDNANIAGLTQPIPVYVPTLAGTASVGLQLGIDQAQGGTNGLALALGAEAVAIQPISTTATTDVLVTGVQPPVTAATSEFLMEVSADGADAFLQAYWLAGGVQLTLSGVTQPSQFLSARILYPFVPQVKEIAPDGDTPLILEVSSGSPPLASFTSGGPVTVTLGEAQVTALLDFCDGTPPLELFTLRVPLEVQAQATVVSGAIQLSNLQAPVVSVDVVNEPVTPLDDQAIASFLGTLIPFLLQQYSTQLPPIPIPALPAGFTLSNAGVGVGPGWLSVWGDF